MRSTGRDQGIGERILHHSVAIFALKGLKVLLGSAPQTGY